MKIMKISFLIFCFLVASFIAAYAGGGTYVAQALNTAQGKVTVVNGFVIPDGTTANWLVRSEVCITQIGGSARAYSKGMPRDEAIKIVGGDTLTGMCWVVDQSEVRTAHTDVCFVLEAQVISGTGGGATATGSAWW